MRKTAENLLLLAKEDADALLADPSFIGHYSRFAGDPVLAGVFRFPLIQEGAATLNQSFVEVYETTVVSLAHSLNCVVTDYDTCTHVSKIISALNRLAECALVSECQRFDDALSAYATSDPETVKLLM